MEFPPLWLVYECLAAGYEFGEALAQDATLGVINTRDLRDAKYRLRKEAGDFDALWPRCFPLPVVSLPEWFAPDFWSFGSFWFASSRLREALAQGGDAVQFLPFELIRAGAAARAQDYYWMRVIARQRSLDLSRCECEVESYADPITGEPALSLSNIQLLALQYDLQPRTEIFRVEESRTFVLVTDGLAARVLDARCTGMEFSDPANRHGGMRVDRLRTRDGIAERRVGYLD